MTDALPVVSPRSITDREIAFFEANGWLKIESLIARRDAELLLARLKELMGDDAMTGQHPERADGLEDRWRVFASLAVDLTSGAVRDELFHSISHSHQLGAIGSSLLGESVRFWVDQSLVKMPHGVAGSSETSWHADTGARDDTPFRPARQVNVWIALSEVTPEHGAMRFIPPRYVTDEIHAICSDTPVEETYGQLEELGVLSPPLHLMPGDATVHGASTFHSAPPNRTATPRWAYFVSMFPADAVYTGHPVWPMVGVPDVLEGERFPDARFPVLA
jgi:hypothetical protein